jgi:alginate O-acetyltransferase complex protein AlgI
MISQPIFVSFWFIAFALAFFPLFWLVRWPKARLVVLATGCIVFHFHFAGPAGVIPIIVLALLTYTIALTRNRALCILGITACAAALVFYKYTSFFSVKVIGLIYAPLGAWVSHTASAFLPAAPPLAISFFVFEFVHYLFDVRRGQSPISNPLHFGLFSIFWPSLVAGPIKRYQTFIPQIAKGELDASPSLVASGLLRVAAGMVKKGLADNLTIWLAFQAPQFSTLDIRWRWLFFVAQALRIYWDFSGYSDIAIGFARMMGIRLMENFNWPYLSTSMGEFWRRWHISLSSWIRDYIYIPIGGSHHGLPRKSFNAILAFAVCGLWHGADWNFVVWGLYHGAGLVINANYVRILGRPGVWLETIMKRVPPLSIVLTFGYVGVGWFFFFYPLQEATNMLRLLVSNNVP